MLGFLTSVFGIGNRFELHESVKCGRRSNDERVVHAVVMMSTTSTARDSVSVERKSRRGGRRSRRRSRPSESLVVRKEPEENTAKESGSSVEASMSAVFVEMRNVGIEYGSNATRASRVSEKATHALTAAQRLSNSRSMNTRRPNGTAETDNSSGGDHDSGSESSGRLVILLEFLLGLGLSIEDCGKIVRRRPQLLRLRIPTSTDPYLDFLKNAPLNMKERQIRRVIRHAPQIFSKKIHEFNPRLEFLRDDLSIDGEELAAVVAQRPHVLWMSIANVKRSVNWLESELGLDSKETRKSMVSAPGLFLERVSTLPLCVEWIKTELHLETKQELHDFVVTFPKVFMYNREVSLQQRVNYLKNKLKLTNATIAQIARNAPVTFEKSVARDLKTTVASLQQWKLGLDAESLNALVMQAPKVFDTKFEARLKFLRDEIGLDGDQIVHVIRAFPGTLLLSVDRSLKPKWEFLKTAYGGSVDDLMANPTFFQSSLEKTLLPRFAYVCMHAERTSLSQLSQGTDAEFCASLGDRCSLQDYEKFEKEGAWMMVYTPVL